MEALSPSDQSLKTFTPKSGVRIPDDTISTEKSLNFNSQRKRIMQKIKKKCLQKIFSMVQKVPSEIDFIGL